MRRRVFYSPALTLVPTYECFNRCGYCNFRQDPGQGDWLSLAGAGEQLRSLRNKNLTKAPSPRMSNLSNPSVFLPQVSEILLLSGEVHPQSDRRSAWVQRIYDLAELALSLGFLPHTNAGPLSFGEMEHLKRVNVSMGLMLEQMTPKLLETVHRHAPSKQPALRLEQLSWAGQLKIPFTTGLLLGIGETRADRIETLEAIAQVHDQWDHIQEVILQPHSPGKRQQTVLGACAPVEFIETIRLAREILPATIALQIPPNLIQTPELLWVCLKAGASDLGGIGPKDEVNPDYAHPLIALLKQQLAAAGYELVPRLPVHERHIEKLLPSLKARCRAVQAEWCQAAEQAQFDKD